MKYTAKAKKQLLHDILEICRLLKQTEQYQILSKQIIGLIDQKNKGDNFIREILLLIKVVAGFDAVGIRFREGADFPYFETIGFEEDFIKTRCESVVLIPIRCENKIIGFLQLHDRRKDVFTPDLIRLFERIGTGIAKNVRLNRPEDMHFLPGKNMNMMDETIITFHDENFNIISANKTAKEILRLPPLDGAEVKCYTFYHGKDCPPSNCPSCKCILNRDPVTFEMNEPHLRRRIKVMAFPRFDTSDKFIGLIHYVRVMTKERIVPEKFPE